MVLFTEILSHYGMTMDNLQAVYVSFTDGISELNDGNCDAVVVMAATPTSAIIELSAKTNKWKMVQFDQKVLDKLVESSSYFVKKTIKAGTYTGLKEDYKTIGASRVMMCRVDMKEGLVYNICKAFMTIWMFW